MTKKSPAWRSRIIRNGEANPEELLANPLNWRIHPKNQQEALEAIVDEVGWVAGVIVNQRTGFVVDGHLRVAMALRHGEKSLPVQYVDLDENEEKLVLATLDPIASMAATDRDQMAALMEGIEGDTRVTDLLGLIAKQERVAYGHPAPEPEMKDEAEALNEKWKVKRGDLWLVGRHRLLCGDCTDANDVARLLDGHRPLLCVTDPPYGVEYDPSWRNEEARKGNLAYAASRVGQVTNDDRSDWREAWDLFPGDVIYSWHPAGAPSLVHAAALQGSGFVIRMQIIWAKSNFPIGRGDYHVRHEPCWYAVRKGKSSRRTEDRTQTTLWEINLDQNVAGGHSTQKPLECMARPIRNHDAPEVYDPFLGSGTTMVACDQLSRKCYALEIDPKYVAVALERLSMLGLKPARS